MRTQDWASVRCEKHDIPSCADCLEAHSMRREGSGVRYSNDCSVATLAELTGLEDYDFCADVIREAGGRLGKGTTFPALKLAFESLGYVVTERPDLSPGSARTASAGGTRRFYVCAFYVRARRTVPGSGHAWTIQDGKAARNFARYNIARVYEISE